MSREFVDAIADGNNIEAEKAFKQEIVSKVGDTLELKRREVAKDLASSLPTTEEENDQV
tara:strand:+ start:862 stop:1038 length:177 start_codon:yes stop_codon:yes gene_type:complete